MTDRPTIIYTHTDEAPALATYSFLPMIQAFSAPAGIEVETRDISLSGRIIANFPDHLEEGQRIGDALAELGEMTSDPGANIIKLPNISASIPQLKAAIAELQSHGYAVPNYPDEPSNDAEADIKARYDRIKGSAVNPVLREGNSDRRAPQAVKEFARNNPHRLRDWTSDAKFHVAHMSGGDFFANEQSVSIEKDTTVHIEMQASGGDTTMLREDIALEAGDVIDATFMSCKALVKFLGEQMDEAKRREGWR